MIIITIKLSLLVHIECIELINKKLLWPKKLNWLEFGGMEDGLGKLLYIFLMFKIIFNC